MNTLGKVLFAAAAAFLLSSPAAAAEEVKVPAATAKVQSASSSSASSKASKASSSSSKKQVAKTSRPAQAKTAQKKAQPASSSRAAGNAKPKQGQKTAQKAAEGGQAVEKVAKPTATPEQIAACYTAAKTSQDRQGCLRKEHSAVRAEYNAVANEVLLAAQRLDRNSGDKQHAKAFNSANRAYEQYIKAECESLKHFRGGGAEGENARLACVVNMMRLRQGSLESEFVVTETK